MNFSVNQIFYTFSWKQANTTSIQENGI